MDNIKYDYLLEYPIDKLYLVQCDNVECNIVCLIVIYNRLYLELIYTTFDNYTATTSLNPVMNFVEMQRASYNWILKTRSIMLQHDKNN